MNKIIHYFFRNKKLIFLSVFALAFGTRCIMTIKTPTKNKWIDLNIYIDGGQLISNKINPYNFNDSPVTRNKLRTDSVATGWQCETQERWNSFASSNLPLTLLFFGLVDTISTGNAILYRLSFNFFDALLSALIVLFCIQFWKLKPTVYNLLLMLGLAAFSPTFWFWGTVFPEDKGIQILLMLGAVYAAKNNRWQISAVLLGASVAYKGLGIFIAPLSLYYAIGSPESFSFSKNEVRKIFKYTALALITAALFFAPFFPEVMSMMKFRMHSNITTTPTNGSMWVYFYKFFPTHWLLIRNLFLLIFTGGFLFVFLFKRFNMAAISAYTLILFTLLLLLNGSLDRMNIAIMFSTLIFGLIDLNFAKILGWYTIVGGTVMCCLVLLKSFGGLDESIDSLYCFIYVLLCTYYVFRRVVNPTLSR